MVSKMVVDVNLDVKTTDDDDPIFVLKEGRFALLTEMTINENTRTVHVPASEVFDEL